MIKSSGNETDRKIVKKYLIPKDSDPLPINARHLIDILDKEGKLKVPIYDVIDSSLSSDNLSEKLGFTADNKIAELVVSFNRIGIRSITSCEGHKNRGYSFSNVGFWGSNLYEIMSIIKDWSLNDDINNVAIIAGEGVDDYHHAYFNLAFITGNIESSRQLANNLSKFITKSSCKT